MQKIVLIIFLIFLCGPAMGKEVAPTNVAVKNHVENKTVNPNAFRNTLGYSLGVGGTGSVWGINFNFMAYQRSDGSGLNLRFTSRMNFGSFAHIKNGLFDPIWYNGMHFLWQSRPISNLFRLYGGGGVWYGWRPRTLTDPDNCYLPRGKMCSGLEKSGAISGGGFTGIEFFDNVRTYFIEIGAQGAAHPNRMDGGLFLHAGSNFFL